MPNPLSSLLSGWISREPVAGLLLLVSASLILARGLSLRPSAGAGIRAWTRSLLEALAGSLLFLGMAAAFAFLLNSDYTGFSKLYGSFTTVGSQAREGWLDWQSRYGGPLTQPDLVVRQFIRGESIEPLPPEESGGRTLYRTVQVEEPLSGNSITGFEGQLVMELADPEHPLQSFNAYTLAADYRYRIVNPSDSITLVRFFFPLPDARLISNLHLEMNGSEVPWHVQEQAMAWESTLDSGETAEVRVHYRVRGMDYYLFQVSESRQVTDFSLSLALNSVASGIITNPDGAVELEVSDQGRLVTWKIGNAIAAPQLGIYMTQGWPYAPAHALIVLLPYAARALLFFLSMAAFTLLIAGCAIDLRQLALLAAVFTLPFLLLMSGSIPRLAFILPQNWASFQGKMLPLLGLLAIALAWMILRGVPPLPRTLILLLMGLFLCLYPFAGLIPDEQKRNAVLGGAQAGMIFYIFAYSLFTRVRRAGVR